MPTNNNYNIYYNSFIFFMAYRILMKLQLCMNTYNIFKIQPIVLTFFESGHFVFTTD